MKIKKQISNKNRSTFIQTFFFRIFSINLLFYFFKLLQKDFLFSFKSLGLLVSPKVNVLNYLLNWYQEKNVNYFALLSV